MAVLFKVPPQEVVGDTVALEARSYGPVRITRGDRVFLWWSEAQGGAGLVGYGLCIEATAQANGWSAVVEVVTDRYRGFAKATLAPFRDAGDGSPQASLAAKLYRHALNKVVAISPDEEVFLRHLIERAFA